MKLIDVVSIALSVTMASVLLSSEAFADPSPGGTLPPPRPQCANHTCTPGIAIQKERTVGADDCWILTNGELYYDKQVGQCQRYSCSTTTGGSSFYYAFSGWTDSVCVADPIYVSQPVCPLSGCDP